MTQPVEELTNKQIKSEIKKLRGRLKSIARVYPLLTKNQRRPYVSMIDRLTALEKEADARKEK